jgi:hypothetical protein
MRLDSRAARYAINAIRPVLLLAAHSRCSCRRSGAKLRLYASSPRRKSTSVKPRWHASLMIAPSSTV